MASILAVTKYKLYIAAASPSSSPGHLLVSA